VDATQEKSLVGAHAHDYYRFFFPFFFVLALPVLLLFIPTVLYHVYPRSLRNITSEACLLYSFSGV
jgi:hypothetical protein